MKIRPMGAELFHAEKNGEAGWQAQDKTNNRFSKFYERP